MHCTVLKCVGLYRLAKSWSVLCSARMCCTALKYHAVLYCLNVVNAQGNVELQRDKLRSLVELGATLLNSSGRMCCTI